MSSRLHRFTIFTTRALTALAPLHCMSRPAAPATETTRESCPNASKLTSRGVRSLKQPPDVPGTGASVAWHPRPGLETPMKSLQMLIRGIVRNSFPSLLGTWLISHALTTVQLDFSPVAQTHRNCSDACSDERRKTSALSFLFISLLFFSLLTGGFGRQSEYRMTRQDYSARALRPRLR